SYFGRLGDALAPLAATGIEGLAADLVAGDVDEVAANPALRGLHLVAGVVDGRNVWRTDPDAALETLERLRGTGTSLAVSTSCSLLHVPYTLTAETGMDESLRGWLAFGYEKMDEVAVLARAYEEGPDTVADAFNAARTA